MMQKVDQHGPSRYRAITSRNVENTSAWERLSPELRRAVRVVSAVLPFRTNEYVMNELIDWSRAPNDPIFQLTFPQRGMLNPHPAGQMTHNVPTLDGRAIDGIQHKYRQSILFFPSQAQTCHAYCTFCFRWPQFVGLDNTKFASREVDPLVAYLRAHPEITDVIITGGDPMVMKTRVLSGYLHALTRSGLDSLRTIRIGTKAPCYWPQRFVTDGDADDLLRLFGEVVNSGKNLDIMGHFSHPTELAPDIAQTAIRRIRSTGANVYMQSPVVRHVNDDPDTWATLWRAGVSLGCVPYYMFVERDTGAKDYFELPLLRAWQIYRDAYRQVSGIARTVRGPSMSAFPGKVNVMGVRDVGEESAFVLQYLQARNPDLVGQPFFARFDPNATWFEDLKPLTAADEPFFDHSIALGAGFWEERS